MSHSAALTDIDLVLDVTEVAPDAHASRWLSCGGLPKYRLPDGLLQQPNTLYRHVAMGMLVLFWDPLPDGGTKGTLVILWRHDPVEVSSGEAHEWLSQMPALKPGWQASTIAERVPVASVWSKLGLHRGSQWHLTKGIIRTLSACIGHPHKEGAWAFNAISKGCRAATLRSHTVPEQTPRMSLWIPT